MKNGTPSVSEEDLHAFLDGELPTSHRSAVEAYLREHPQEAARLDAYRRDGEAIARLFSMMPTAAQSGGAPSNLSAPRRHVAWQYAAAAAAVFVIGSEAGWLARDHIANDPSRHFGYEAETAYRLASGSAVEVRPSASLSQLSEAVSAALGMRVKLDNANLPGMSLAQVRIVQQPRGPTVQLALAAPNAGLVTLYFEKRPGAKDTPFREVSQKDLTTLIWQEEGVECAISGRLPAKELEEIARQLYKSLLS